MEGKKVTWRERILDGGKGRELEGRKVKWSERK